MFLFSSQPLTLRGIEQAKSLGRSPQLSEHSSASFWRIYSSDLKRTRHTTQLLLRSLQNKDSSTLDEIITNDVYNPDDPVVSGVSFDPRLREIAKGARQGLPKSLSYQEALAERQRLREEGSHFVDDAIPLLESEDDGWARIVDWLQEVATDVVHDAKTARSDNSSECCVLVIAHSGLYRAFLQRLLGPDRLRAHPDATYDKIDGRFRVPNASLTILDIRLPITPDDDEGGDDNSQTDGKDASNVLSVLSNNDIDIVLLTSTEHYRVREDVRKNVVAETLETL
jgi:broad specificity phosphatase PhoE